MVAAKPAARRRSRPRLDVLRCLREEAETNLERAASSRRRAITSSENCACGNMALLSFVAVRG
jgi:hypothetical protein